MSLFNPSSTQHVGLILSERLINMPVQVAPHMYRLLCDEIKWALDEVILKHMLIIATS